MPAKQKSLDALLVEINQRMDFNQWWSAEGSRRDYAASEKARPEVSKFAYRFIVDPSIGDSEKLDWQKPAAEQMVKALQRSWKVEAVTDLDCTKRPWLVFHCFFQLLSRRQVPPDDLKNDSWQVEFVKRLPKEPYTKDWAVAGEQELIASLQDLADRLGADKSNIASTLVTNIAQRMNYTKWRQDAGKLIHKDRENGSSPVEEFVRRFSTNQ
jgi:hypothetical protein